MPDYKKVLVIDDSAFMRRVITDMINSDSRCKVIGFAKNGKEGLQKIQELEPDVITLDIEMPIMTGLEMLEKLPSLRPTPAIVISTLAEEGAEATIKALELGAIDFITKPTNIFKMDTKEMKEKLIEKVLVSSNLPQHKCMPKKNDRLSKIRMDHKGHKPFTKESSTNNTTKIVAIGTSTGGPRALQQVLPFIPGNIPAAIIIVQHMPPGFTKSLANRLDSLSEITVKEAEEGDILRPGVAYIAPGDYHIVVQKSKHSDQCSIHLSNDPPVGGHRPAVNVMMNTLSETGLQNIIGIIMTGMGSDGCEGLLKLKNNNNAVIIAQNEESCVVYGMPKAVVEAGIADVIVPLEQIAPEIKKIVGVH